MRKLKSSKQLFFIFIVFIYSCHYASAQTNVSLHDSLHAAIEKQSRLALLTNKRPLNENNTTSWLNGVPSVSFQHLESEDSLGTSESEISLKFAIKSGFLRNVEKQLNSHNRALQKSAEQQYALYLSGLIRELLWELKIQCARFSSLKQKQALLSSLASQYDEMAKAQAIPQYISLIVKNELNQLGISFIQYQRNIDDLRAQYFRITGLSMLPKNIVEQPLNKTQLHLDLHPDILALDANFNSIHQQFLGASKHNSPWNIQLTGRHVSVPGFSENQLGIGIEVPINIGSELSIIQQSEYSKMVVEYEIAKKKRLLQLTEKQTAELREYEFLQQKQTLLDESLDTLNDLNNAMNQLRESNAPNQEYYIRTLLSLVDTKQNIELNRLFIRRQIALIRQAAGISL